MKYEESLIIFFRNVADNDDNDNDDNDDINDDTTCQNEAEEANGTISHRLSQASAFPLPSTLPVPMSQAFSMSPLLSFAMRKQPSWSNRIQPNLLFRHPTSISEPESDDG